MRTCDLHLLTLHVYGKWYLLEATYLMPMKYEVGKATHSRVMEHPVVPELNNIKSGFLNP